MLWELINFFLQSFMIHTARAWELAEFSTVSKGELGSMSITLAPGTEKGECRVSLASQSSLAGASGSVQDSIWENKAEAFRRRHLTRISGLHRSQTLHILYFLLGIL